MARIGQYTQDVLDGRRIVDGNRHDGIVFGKNGILNPALVYHREQHGCCGEELFAMPLDKRGRRRADADDQIKWPVGEDRIEILDERAFGIFVAGAGDFERVLVEIQLPRRLTLEFGADRFGILAPRLEIPAKRMKQQNSLGLSCPGSRSCGGSY